MKRVFLSIGILLLGLCMTGCSLLRVTVSTGDPLPRDEARMRLMTRGFYGDFSTAVEQTADSIAALTRNPQVRMAAIRWKIRATRAGVDAAMQSLPDVALADLWMLCRRMHGEFDSLPDAQLFGAESPLARQTAALLDRRIVRLAEEVLDKPRFALMQAFVKQYPDTGADNTLLAWVEFLRAHGVDRMPATGSIAEVLSDVNDRVSNHTQQFSNTLGWSKDLIEMQLRQDSLRGELNRRLDSLDLRFARLAAVAEGVPDLSEELLQQVDGEARSLIRAMNLTVDRTFKGLDTQREAQQQYLSRQLVVEVRKSADQVVQRTLDELPHVVGRLLFYILLTLCILIGGPFAVGIWLGRRSRKS